MLHSQHIDESIEMQGYEEAARQAALWALYALDVTQVGTDEALTHAYTTYVELTPELGEHWEDVVTRVEGVTGMLEALDDQIQQVSPRWKLERMASIDRNILRLGAWEILSSFRTPIATINACVEIGKVYGEKGTPAFINGLLDQLCKNHRIRVA